MARNGNFSKVLIAALGLCFLALAGCEKGQFGKTEIGALSGTALGAGLGAIIGHETGHTGAGIAIGSAAGALGGGLLGSQFDKTDQSLAEREARMAEQDRILQENKKILEELRSRGADVRTTDRGVVVNLPDVLFEFNRSRLTAGARDTVRDIADVVKTVSNRDIFVEGHTDSVGTIAYNQKLSEERAWSVADELVSNGVQRRHVFTKGFGESTPIASNATDAGRGRNRRVEVVIAN
jgi:outer membrane protein OmpA-like peptidoglycan-associated protein